jgi:hypothetical protein
MNPEEKLLNQAQSKMSQRLFELAKERDILIEALKQIIRYSDEPFTGSKWDLERKEIAKEALSKVTGAGE